MTRLLTILILLLAGLPQVGIGMTGMTGMFGASAGHDCADMVCQQPVIAPTECCDESEPVVDMDEYCSMSGGACRCGVAPADDRVPNPKAPLQRSDTQITLGLSKALVELPRWNTPADAGQAVATDLVVGLASLRTHNETQALLGIWQT
ncbi:MAG: hypothetical protein JKY43_01565 [Phycisphaerales bacterium]|nr:hypothetical protein [Phycisphaerales bacterium]